MEERKEKPKKLLCHACGVELVEGKADFHYMGHAFVADVPRCPKCGYVYVSEALADGRIKDVEAALEEK